MVKKVKKYNTISLFLKYNMKNAGFTLVETLVAVSVLVIAIAAPLTLASQSLFVATYSKDQLTASYLAQEAIEMVRNKRDVNMLKFLGGNTSVNWLDGISTSTPFLADTKNDSISGVCGSTEADCRNIKLKFDGDFYTYGSGLRNTRFGRSVVVAEEINRKEALITSVVSWRTGSFKEQKVKITSRIYNWVPDQQ